MTDTSAANGRRVAKNTLMLYIRMFLVMGVSFYTSRVVLQTLGVTDFGIYNVVGGVVAMFGFIHTSLSGACSRFITYALGKGDEKELSETFSTVMTIFYLLILLIFILAETVGLWFVMEKLVIPPERHTAALWVYQGSVVSTLIMLVSVPYNALLIAHERMSAFAYVSVYEVIAKLIIVFLIQVIPFDRLITYALLVVVVQLSVRIIYTVYSRRHFPESHYRLHYDRKRFREIFYYAGWTLNGNLAVIGFTQGLNILLNLFFGPAVNAARGIAMQIQTGVNQFYSSFQAAATPQITKTYAHDELPAMRKLVLSTQRSSFYLILLISLPFLFQTEYILHLWLGQVPAHSANFVRIIVLLSMNSALNGPVITAVHATGRIKRFQLIEGSMLLSVVPVAWLLLKFAHISPEEVFLTFFFIEVITQLVRVWLVFPMIELPISRYYTKVLWPIAKVCAVVWVLPAACVIWWHPTSDFLTLVLVVVVCVLSTLACVYFLGVSRSEKDLVHAKLAPLLNRFRLNPSKT